MKALIGVSISGANTEKKKIRNKSFPQGRYISCTKLFEGR